MIAFLTSDSSERRQTWRAKNTAAELQSIDNLFI
jgi:hypothetical protein